LRKYTCRNGVWESESIGDIIIESNEVETRKYEGNVILNRHMKK